MNRPSKYQAHYICIYILFLFNSELASISNDIDIANTRCQRTLRVHSNRPKAKKKFFFDVCYLSLMFHRKSKHQPHRVHQNDNGDTHNVI